MHLTTFNPFSVAIEEVLYENNTDEGRIAIYQTHALGLTVIYNDDIILTQENGFFYNEMLTHPAIFTHTNPKKIAIIGPAMGLLSEIVKHAHVAAIACITAPTAVNVALEQYCERLYPPIEDTRITYYKDDAQKILPTMQGMFDIIIHTQLVETTTLPSLYYTALNKGGILIKPCTFAWTAANEIKSSFQCLAQAGFSDWQTLHFPEPLRLHGSRMVLMAKTHGLLNPIREKDIYNRTFMTRYYNYDTHKAALVIPEFMREAWD